MRKPAFIAALLACTAAVPLAAPLAAKEGMFTPDQLPLIAEDLRATGLQIAPEALSDLTGFPMGAIVSLGGCSASFVSPEGLVVTNHHCARGSVQYNSTAENNYLVDGFLAPAKSDELPAAPGSRIYVTVAEDDVTARMREGTEALDPTARYDLLEQRNKDIVAECEQDAGYRCLVASFYGGAQYKLIKRLEVRDVRLVYAPADSIGKYGGDIDNWQWPRHTGDFAFYRAYVAPDGSAADYAEENVPYRPEHHLKVSAGGLKEGDFVMAAGYPGSTQRYAMLAEVENTFDWQYPTFVTLLNEWIDTIEAAAPAGSDARVKYESRLAGLNNYEKNLRGQIEGARRVGLVDRRRMREAALAEWIAADGARAPYGTAITQLSALADESAAAARTDFWYNYATNAQLLSAAQRIYRLAQERQKPDAEREPGYQERDMTFFRQGLQALDRRYDASVDQAEWLLFLDKYLAQPEAARVNVLDRQLGISGTPDRAALRNRIEGYYEQTRLDEAEYRESLLEATPEQLEASEDPFIELAVALYDYERSLEAESEARTGRELALRPAYMQAITGWQGSEGKLAYPDANSTLRVTYGTVLGGSPRDGMAYLPFTTLEGLLAKDTGEEPFNAPAKLLQEIRAEDYGRYELESIDSVPVNFLSDLDSTGGNSGSATLNARAELVGLLFDGTFESVNSDWDFDPRTTRTIHVDTRYMLWVMDKVDGADALIAEMDIVE
ncbi:S46 family peptidase [Qipengyuania sp. DY56-A-20]|uniref:Dipeptidyl-peptidase n=1 Tax=Qipengyuania benthica TaxID=3067651 RepID=A0ABT9H689_9SPHN|nr:S46 family peptidase [Qipengyuania sp. DY56-A-20]MDP4538828.1 S46 family peptidase [Qipengyuania sp. DY56-A-20]